MTTPSQTSPVDRAVEQVRLQFAGHAVQVVREIGGDAVIIIDEVLVGEQYDPPRTWFGFRISSAYPNADVYPHYVGRIARRDDNAHGAAIQPVEWEGRSALQVSRRSNGWNPRTDTAALKAIKVLTWLAAQ